MSPVIIFTTMSFITGQYFMSQINSSLKNISKDINDIIKFLFDDKESRNYAIYQLCLDISTTMDIIKAIKPTNKEIKALRYIVFLTPFLVSMFISMPLILTLDATLSKRRVLKSVLNPFNSRTTEKRNAAIFTTALGLRITNIPNTTTMIPEIK